ncbi:MAG: PEP-CTERM sorting domain-containing protein [Phycisphaeraceae bacterium]|nr:PEP-CTERM sorting domain-containing protein [Phycisphaeraceae bacterium]
MFQRPFRAFGLIVAAGLLASASTAVADLNGDLFRITARSAANPSDWASLIINSSEGSWNGDVFTVSVTNRMFRDAGGAVDTRFGRLNSLDAEIHEDPSVAANFNVQGGVFNTIYSVESVLLSFPAIASAQGFASAQIGVTDQDGDGATIAPTNGGHLYRAYYNSLPGTHPYDGTLFSGSPLLPGSVVAGPNGSNILFGDSGSFIAIGVPVSDISALFEFSVSAFDLAAGTSTFTVVPAPGAVGLLGLAGLAMARRRR